MPTVSHEEVVVEMLQEDPEFMRLYIEDTMQEEDETLFKIAMRHIIKAKGFNFDLVDAREKEAA